MSQEEIDRYYEQYGARVDSVVHGRAVCVVQDKQEAALICKEMEDTVSRSGRWSKDSRAWVDHDRIVNFEGTFTRKRRPDKPGGQASLFDIKNPMVSALDAVGVVPLEDVVAVRISD